MKIAGIDVGAGIAKLVIIGDGKIIAYSIKSVTSNITKVIQEVTKEALEKARLSLHSLDYVVSTGYGRNAGCFCK